MFSLQNTNELLFSAPVIFSSTWRNQKWLASHVQDFFPIWVESSFPPATCTPHTPRIWTIRFCSYTGPFVSTRDLMASLILSLLRTSTHVVKIRFFQFFRIFDDIQTEVSLITWNACKQLYMRCGFSTPLSTWSTSFWTTSITTTNRSLGNSRLSVKYDTQD